MEDLLKKIPSFVKPSKSPRSSKKSSSSSSRSSTPSPPLLPPSPPPEDIPIPLPAKLPLAPDKLPHPPFVTAGHSLTSPLPSTSPPSPVLTQTAVIQRDYASRVFEPSPLSKELPPPITQTEQEQIERQRGRYHFRKGKLSSRISPSQPSSPTNGVETDRKSVGDKTRSPLIPPTLPTTPMIRDEKRSGPATTFEEILGIDGTAGVVEDVTFSKSLSQPTASLLGPQAELSGILPLAPYVGKSRDDRVRETFSRPAQSNKRTGGDSGIGSPQPLTSSHTGPLLLISAIVDPEIVNGRMGDIIGATPLKLPEDLENIHDEVEDPERLPHILDSAPTPTIADLNLVGPTGTNEPSIPQSDGNSASRLQIEPASIPAVPDYRPDPFGIRITIPTGDVIRLAENGRRASCCQRIKRFLSSEARIIKNGAVHVLTTGPRMENSGETDMAHLEEPGESEEDMGTRKAKGVSRSWNRTDLMISYVLLVFLGSYYSLGSVHSEFVIKEAVNDFTMRGEVRYYQFELALSMLGVSRILGIIAFVKLTNSYSRPLALFIAILVAIGGVGTAASAVTWEAFSAGHALFHLGRSGALIVAQVIVADTSDLGWRGALCWGLEAGIVVWIWTKPAVETFILEKLGWNIPIWTFFSFAFPVSIPPITAVYVFHRRAKHWGFFPALQNVHKRPWWNLKGLWKRVKLFFCESDSLGILLWTIGIGLLSTAFSFSEKMQAGIGTWTIGLLIGGSICIMLLVLWEVWLNDNLETAHKLGRQVARPNTSHRPGVSRDVLPNERTMITGPAGYDSISMEQVAVELSARIAETQQLGKPKGWRRRCGAYRQRCCPLFQTRLLKRRSIPIGCLIGFLASFAMKVGFWSVWDRPENLPSEYEQLVESLQGESFLVNIESTSFMAGGLLVSFLIRTTKIFKVFVVSGLLLLLCGLLIFHYTDIYFMQKPQVIVSQATIGFGSGIVWISLLVGVQASCKKHSDVGMSAGLLMTSNALGEMTAEAMKRFMQSYMMNLLPPETSQKYFLRALNGHWSVLLLISMAATAFALIMAGVGLEGHNLDEIKQLVSGVVFGMDDVDRQKTYVEHPSWATPSPFIATPGERNLPHTPESPPSNTSFERTHAQVTAGSNTTPRLSQDRSPRINFPSASEVVSQAQDSLIVGGYSTRDHESTPEWETTPSESVVSELHTTSDSCTIISPAQVPDSYTDGIFTMDSDMEQTPRAISSNAFQSSEDLGNEIAISPQIETVGGKGPSTMKQRIFRSRITKEPYILAGSCMAGGQEFSFKKRQIGAMEVAHRNDGNSDTGNKLGWSGSITGEGVESRDIGDCFTDFSERSRGMYSSLEIPYSTVEWEVVSQNINDEQDSNPQLGSSGDDIMVQSRYFGEGLGSGLVAQSPQVTTTTSPDGGGDLQRYQDSMEGGRVSRFAHREHILLREESTQTSPNISQLSIAEIASEVDTLTEKNSYSPEKCLSPIEELSSRGSVEDSIILPFNGSMGTGNLPPMRAPIVIGLLSPRHHRIHDGSEEPASSGNRSIMTLATVKRKGEKKGKEKASCRDNE